MPVTDTALSAHTPLKVAIFTETFLPKLDGVVTITCLLLDHLKRRGIDAVVFAPGQHPAEYNGFPVVSMPGVPSLIYPEVSLAIPGRRVYDLLAEADPDVIHIINPWVSGLQGMRIARRLNKPLVLSFHTHLMRIARFYGAGLVENGLWRLHRYFYNKADLRLATSRAVVDELHAHGFKKTLLWRRGVDTSVFSPEFYSAAMRERLTNGAPDKTLLLFVGRVAPEKQIDQLRYALQQVENTHLAIVGDGPARAKLESVFAGLPVTFTGNLKGRDLSMAYASSDIFAFPSAIETFGLVIAEAMASGLAVVTSRVGGVPELIRHGENGYIFEPNDTDMMVRYVRELAQNPDRRRAMGAAAHGSIQGLTWEAIMDELIGHYGAVMRDYAGRSAESGAYAEAK